MVASFTYIFICLLAGIAIIVLLTAKLRVHAFFALLIACFVVGLSVGLPMNNVISVTKDGFGNIMKSLGLIIVLGTTLGILLEHTGSTKVMASFIFLRHISGVPRKITPAMSGTVKAFGTPNPN